MRESDHIAALRSRAFLVLVGALFLSGCDMVVLNPAGDIALQQRNLILFATAVMLLIIVPVLVLTVVFAWRYRRGNPNKNYDPEFDHSTTLELVIWACPLLIIIALSAVTWTHTHLLDPFRPLERLGPGRSLAKGTKPLEVQVVALEWKWLFIYPEQGIATVNDLALPVDVPVRFSITSTDQFATFYAPTLAGMIYAMPGMDSKLNAVLNKPGQTWGYSGNYTGEGHSTMRFRLTGLRLADFDRWAREVKQGGGLPLEASRYLALEKPSEKVPFIRFSSVSPTLFDRIVNRCVEAGRPCMNQTMSHDMRHGGGSPDAGGLGSGTMPGHGSMPAPGGKPEAALDKDAGDKGSSPKVGMPVGPDYNARGRDAETPAKPQTPKAQANP